MKKTLKVALALGLGLGLVATNLVENEENNIDYIYQQAIENGYEENPEIDYMTNPMTGEKTKINKKELELTKVETTTIFENEQNVFDMNDENDIVYYIPMKAFAMETNEIKYTGLADGQGHFYLTPLHLKDGQNYVIMQNIRTNEILKIEEATFEFSYELDFELYESDYMFEIEEEFLSEMVNL